MQRIGFSIKYVDAIRTATIVSAVALSVSACAPEEPLNVGYYMQDDIIRENTIVRCQSDRFKYRKDGDCINARIATERIARISERATEAERRAAFERKRLALRAREQALRVREEELRLLAEAATGAAAPGEYVSTPETALSDTVDGNAQQVAANVDSAVAEYATAFSTVQEPQPQFGAPVSVSVARNEYAQNSSLPEVVQNVPVEQTVAEEAAKPEKVESDLEAEIRKLEEQHRLRLEELRNRGQVSSEPDAANDPGPSTTDPAASD